MALLYKMTIPTQAKVYMVWGNSQRSVGPTERTNAPFTNLLGDLAMLPNKGRFVTQHEESAKMRPKEPNLTRHTT